MMHERKTVGEFDAGYSAGHVAGKGDLYAVTVFSRDAFSQITEHCVYYDSSVARNGHPQPGKWPPGQREHVAARERKTRPHPGVLTPHVGSVLDEEHDVNEGPSVVAAVDEAARNGMVRREELPHVVRPVLVEAVLGS